jgi:CO dehydrogenase/acetyl-CoA synthase alpha subunit
MVFATFRLLGQANFGTVSRKTLIIRPYDKLLDMLKEKDSQLQKLKEEKDFELKQKEFLLEKVRQEKDSEIKQKQHLIDSLENRKSWR